MPFTWGWEDTGETGGAPLPLAARFWAWHSIQGSDPAHRVLLPRPSCGSASPECPHTDNIPRDSESLGGKMADHLPALGLRSPWSSPLPGLHPLHGLRFCSCWLLAPGPSGPLPCFRDYSPLVLTQAQEWEDPSLISRTFCLHLLSHFLNKRYIWEKTHMSDPIISSEKFFFLSICPQSQSLS